MPHILKSTFAGLLLLISTIPASAQGTSVAFGGLRLDSSLPVEIGADSLSVDQASGQAIFDGNVDIIQGSMRLAANRVEVFYAEDGSQIAKLVATGAVTLANGTEAAEAERAEYDLAASEVILSGNVLLTQNGATISGQRMVVDLATGTGRVDGRVRTVLEPGSR